METSSLDGRHRLVTVRFLSVFDLIDGGNSVCHQNFSYSLSSIFFDPGLGCLIIRPVQEDGKRLLAESCVCVEQD